MMTRDTRLLVDGEYDLAIIGGGAFGAAALWDATLRGLRAVLIERNDFGGGASAECFKIVHGGIRYLQHLDVARLRASCRERSALLRIAPHLVAPLPIVIPTYGRGRKGKAFLGAGMYLYDFLTLDRNAGIPDRSRRIPFTRLLGRPELLDLYPELDDPDLTGAAVFDDGQMYSPPRLVLAFVKSAIKAGATACNYVEASGFIWQGNRVVGIRATDRLGGEGIEIRAKLVLNAAGPGAEYLLAGDPRFGTWKRGSFSRDACFAVRRRPKSRFALAVQGQSRDRDARLGREARHMFIVPWRHLTLIGVWHKAFAAHPDTAAIDDAELDDWIREINGCYPSLALSQDDVVYRNCGLVPFGADPGSVEALSFGKESRFMDHAALHGVQGLVSLVGIRFTTARGDAADALDLLLRQWPAAPARADTEKKALVGGDLGTFEAFRSRAHRQGSRVVGGKTLDRLLRAYGTEYSEILGLADANAADAAVLHGTGTLLAEATFAVQSEMAVRLEDVVLRRTEMGSGCHPGQAALEAVAGRMRGQLGWSAEREQAELAATVDVLARHGAQSAPEDVPR
jgi:glycerol-3-phosphate dehydrogenase